MFILSQFASQGLHGCCPAAAVSACFPWTAVHDGFAAPSPFAEPVQTALLSSPPQPSSFLSAWA